MILKSCLKSMRLRTLPLSLSGVVTGLALASSEAVPEAGTVAALLLTAVFLQILSNLSNELGDTLHGTDRADRQGIHYALQDGEMTLPQMRRFIAVMAVLCCGSGLLMIFFSFGKIFALQPLLFVALGAAAVWAAMHYTLGRNPYGYRGLGDVYVFLFFGLAAVLGSAYICSHAFRPLWLLPACGIGCFSMGVLNVNNIRDAKSDAETRVTLALKLGMRRARIYQTLLIVCGWLFFLTYTLLTRTSGWYVLTLPFFVLHLTGVWRREDRRLDPMLPLLVLSTFAAALLFAFAA